MRTVLVLFMLGVLFLGCRPTTTSPAKPPAGYTIEIRGAGGYSTLHGTGFSLQRNDISAEMKAGRLTVNDRDYGPVADGAKIVVDETGRVTINGVEQTPP